MKTFLIHSETFGTHEVYYNDEDEELVSQHTWRLLKNKNKHVFYVGTHICKENKWSTLRVHRAVLGITDPKIFIDHKNNNGLDNRKENLRVTTNSQNMGNRRSNKNSTSQLKGVDYVQRKRVSYWRAQIQVKGKKTWLGKFQTEEEVARAYDVTALTHFGECALLNFPSE